MKLLVINGPNMNMLAIRQTDKYGTVSYPQLKKLICEHCDKKGIDVDFFQSNYEGAIVEEIQRAYGKYDAIIINPAAYTHTSIAILDALLAVGIPTAEVHITDTDKREPFRKISYIRDYCEKVIIGHGIDGYLEAVDYFAHRQNVPKKEKEKPRENGSVKIEKFTPKGKVEAPPSKSMAHRLILCSALCEGESTVRNVVLSRDIEATLRCITALGAKWELDGSTLKITGTDVAKSAPEKVLDCGESGSTLRFFVPLAWVSGSRFEFTGAKSLMDRPQSEYEEICRRQGVRFKVGEDYILTQGKMSGGTFLVSGNVSSQFISGLLFALPLLEGDSEIYILPPVESKPYIDMTIDTLEQFGIKTQRRSANEIFVPGGQKYRCGDFTVEGDFSNAAFFDAFNFLGGNVQVSGLNMQSKQGDKVYKDIFRALEKSRPTLNLSDCPDLGPIAFALASVKNGAVFNGVHRLRLKESDRIYAMVTELEKLGVTCDVDDDTIAVYPAELHPAGSPLSSHNDHRVAMALSVLLTTVGGEIDNAQAVSKSMPDFFEKLEELGGQLRY